MGAEESFSKVFSTFVTFQTVMFAISISILVMGMRKIVEKGFPRAKDLVWWEEIFVPLSPYLIGALAVFASGLIPDPKLDTRLIRFFYGLVCAAASDLVYAKFKRWLQVATGTAPDGPASVNK